MTRSRILASLLVLGSGLSAQAPRITPGGDPSVRADSIYRLAVSPADFPLEASRFLLDDGVIRLEADGRGTKTYRQIVQILRPTAEEDYQEMRFSYAPKHERFTLNWIRVVRPDGTVISEKPTQVQESDVPAQLGDPVYSDRKVLRVSVSGVKVGTIIDYSSTTEELKPFLPGDASFSWGVSTGLAVARSRYIVDVPAGLRLNLREENLNFKRQEVVANGRRTMVWATKDLPKLKPEIWAADSNGVYMSVQVALPITWAAIGKWYAGNAQGRYALSTAGEEKVRTLLDGARTLDDSLRAIHRFVAQDIRYVAISLGLGGYQPRLPAEVILTGYGDCKDKATLFVAMLNRIGLAAFPVNLNSTGGVRRDMPSIGQFDHAIAAYKRPGRDAYEFVDLTAELTPFGELPFGPQGEFGIVVHPDGATEEVTFPLTSIPDNSRLTRIVGTMNEQGTFTGEFEQSATGNLQYGLRDAFSSAPDSAQRARIANQIASGSFSGAEGRDLVLFDGKDLRARPLIRVHIVDGKAAQIAGGTAILKNPFGAMTSFVAGAREIEAEPARRFPIDTRKIFGYSESRIEYVVTLPDGWRATLPANVDAAGPFGTYRAEYAQTGRELRMTQVVRGTAAVLPPDQIKALVAWMRDVGKDDATVIVIQKPVN